MIDCWPMKTTKGISNIDLQLENYKVLLQQRDAKILELEARFQMEKRRADQEKRRADQFQKKHASAFMLKQRISRPGEITSN